MVLAEFGTGQVFWSMLWFTLFVIWVWLLFAILPTCSAARTCPDGARRSGRSSSSSRPISASSST